MNIQVVPPITRFRSSVHLTEGSTFVRLLTSKPACHPGNDQLVSSLRRRGSGQTWSGCSLAAQALVQVDGGHEKSGEHRRDGNQ